MVDVWIWILFHRRSNRLLLGITSLLEQNKVLRTFQQLLTKSFLWCQSSPGIKKEIYVTKRSCTDQESIPDRGLLCSRGRNHQASEGPNRIVSDLRMDRAALDIRRSRTYSFSYNMDLSNFRELEICVPPSPPTVYKMPARMIVVRRASLAIFFCFLLIKHSWQVRLMREQVWNWAANVSFHGLLMGWFSSGWGTRAELVVVDVRSAWKRWLYLGGVFEVKMYWVKFGNKNCLIKKTYWVLPISRPLISIPIRVLKPTRTRNWINFGTNL